ncbi:sensor histidine kinase [Acidipila rosea]|uniref:histidine kinase n=1 Tax=Acidipila rosea TaxID=768535 RepID=A0A4R1L9Q1_9BACT|nr:ATP-binding protein [Acidipila rosea]MBW4026791.1 HAMP domain-containing protein [Acidobacteriota bacterium]MBW4043370.1 HAMP domain-containing protein [Acidobacteriota bacterium]TCK73673.1 two-component system phosphate regulon sensor histidine kinase PhoR [Acidipila rosea]
MTGRIFTKLWLSFLLVLFIGTATLDLTLRHIISHSLKVKLGPALAEQAMHMLRRDLLLASLIAVVVAALLASMLARSTAQRMERIVAFANRIAAGDLSARMQDGQQQDEISDVARALDATASRLERSFHELESSRRELATLLDSMQEGVVAVNSHGQVIWSNAVMQRMLPVGVRERRPLVETVRDPEVLACVEGALRDHQLRSGKATSLAQGRVYEINAAPTPGGGAVVVLHDLTGVERAEKMRRDFIANVSHELRTPLTSISGYVETLLDSENDVSDQAREFLSIILRNAARMNRLTEDLLALASVESGDYKVKLQVVPASALIEDALDSFAGMAADNGIELRKEETTDTSVMADPDATHQVFGNLIENAMKYGKAGRRVSIGARDLEGEVEFYVRDYGAGIPSEHLDRIFERFYRVDKARSRESGGTGLGLAIAKHIVLAHHGEIRVESELGAGAVFFFTLRRASLEDADANRDKVRTAVHT